MKGGARVRKGSDRNLVFGMNSSFALNVKPVASWSGILSNRCMLSP